MTEPASLSLIQLTSIFFRTGSLAFGGGAATLAMLYDEFCVRRRVLTDEEFQVLFGLSRLVPGMNLLSLTVLLGHRVGGVVGSLLALVSLTVPSFTIIVVGCLFFREGRSDPLIQGAIRGLGVATTALLAHTGWQFCRGALSARRRGREVASGRAGEGAIVNCKLRIFNLQLPRSPEPRLLWAVVAGAATLLALTNAIHPAWVVLAGGAVGGLISRWLGKLRVEG